MSYFKFDDFKKPDGNIDWTAYNKARRENGEICRTCGAMLFCGHGYPQECMSCQKLRTCSDAVMHERMIRCPECGRYHAPDPYEWGGNLYEDGSQKIQCPCCNEAFEVEVHVSYSYTSPKLKDPVWDD